MRGDWALFGEKSKGHELVRQWGSSEVLWKNMVSRTDVPQGLSGMNFPQPIIAGYPGLSGYVFSWMVSHPEASRAGMVITLTQRFDLNGSRGALRKKLSAFISLGSLPHQVWCDLHSGGVQLEDVLESQPAAPDLEVNQNTHALLHTLLNTTKTAVWVPEPGFAEAVASLWLQLYPELRRGMQFRYSQGPNDLGMSDLLTVVYAPIGSLQKWGSNFDRVGPAPQTSTLAAEVLLRNAATHFRDFLQWFERLPTKLHGLGHFERLFGVWQTIAAGNLRLLPQYVQIMNQHALDPIKGQNHQMQLQELLTEFIGQADHAGLQALANLDLTGLTPDPAPFTTVLSHRAPGVMQGLLQQHTDPMIELLLRNDTQVWWQKALKPEFLQHMEKMDSTFAEAVWQWMKSPKLFPLITALITPDTEGRVSQRAPLNISSDLQDRLGELAMDQKWPHLTAWHLARCQDLPEAALRFSKHFTGAGQLHLLLQQYPVESVIHWISESEKLPEHEAASYAAHHPEVFVHFDPQQTRWRRLWLNATEQGMDVLKPDFIRLHLQDYFAFLNETKSWLDVDLQLLEKISLTPQASLLMQPEGWTLLQRMKAPMQQAYLNSTRKEAFRLIEQEEPVKIQSNWLSLLFSGPAIQNAVQDASNPSRMVSRLWKLIEDTVIPDQILGIFRSLKDKPIQLKTEELQAMGKVIDANNWSELARELAAILPMANPAFHGVLWVCQRLLPTYMRGILGFMSFKGVASLSSELQGGPNMQNSFIAADPNNSDNLENLVAQMRKPQGIVPFVGAGLSYRFGMKGWDKFLLEYGSRYYKEEEIQGLLKEKSYEEAADLLFETMGQMTFLNTVKTEYGDHKLEGQAFDGAEKWVIQLTDGVILTTNFDRVLEHAATAQGKPFYDRVMGADFHAAGQLQHEGSWGLIKLHGDYRGQPSSLIFTASQYNHHYGEGKNTVDLDKEVPRLLSHILQGKSLLFLGASLDQDRTMTLLHKLSAPSPFMKHYAILELPATNEEKETKRKFLDAHSILPLWFPTGKYEFVGFLLEYLVSKKTGREPLQHTASPNGIIQSMTNDQAIIQFLAENYPTYRASRDLWIEAGGNAAIVPEADDPRSRWRDLWRGTKNGRINPSNLLRKALEDFPGNPLLLMTLSEQLPADLKQKAILVLQEAIKLHNTATNEDIQQLLSPLQGLPANQIEAALAVATHEAPLQEQQKTEGFWSTFKSKAAETLATDGIKLLLAGIGLGAGWAAKG